MHVEVLQTSDRERFVPSLRKKCYHIGIRIYFINFSFSFGVGVSANCSISDQDPGIYLSLI